MQTNTLQDLRKDTDLWYRLKHLIHDLRIAHLDQDAAARVHEITAMTEYLPRAPYFTSSEHARILSTLVIVPTHSKKDRGDESSEKKKTTVQKAIEETFLLFLSESKKVKRREGREFGLAEVYGTVFGVEGWEFGDGVFGDRLVGSGLERERGNPREIEKERKNMKQKRSNKKGKKISPYKHTTKTPSTPLLTFLIENLNPHHASSLSSASLIEPESNNSNIQLIVKDAINQKWSPDKISTPMNLCAICINTLIQQRFFEVFLFLEESGFALGNHPWQGWAQLGPPVREWVREIYNKHKTHGVSLNLPAFQLSYSILSIPKICRTYVYKSSATESNIFPKTTSSLMTKTTLIRKRPKHRRRRRQYPHTQEDTIRQIAKCLELYFDFEPREDTDIDGWPIPTEELQYLNKNEKLEKKFLDLLPPRIWLATIIVRSSTTKDFSEILDRLRYFGLFDRNERDLRDEVHEEMNGKYQSTGRRSNEKMDPRAYFPKGDWKDTGANLPVRREEGEETPSFFWLPHTLRDDATVGCAKNVFRSKFDRFEKLFFGFFKIESKHAKPATNDLHGEPNVEKSLRKKLN
ncbi:hypothetical protein BDZ45DRAFT_747906 [Acephala macrosclerotiorum]|nr:hypothetical protein BDZ45DRAFT_747906 [Acephala macrosclerotiorum]